MKILGKLLVIICGFVIGAFLLYLLIGIYLKESKLLSMIMTVVAVSYIIGWLLAIIKNIHKPLLVTLTLFVGYIIAEGYLRELVSSFSELSIIVVLIIFTYIGIYLSYKSNKI